MLTYVILTLISYSRGSADWDSIPMPIMTRDLIFFKSQHTKGYTGFQTKTEEKRNHRTISQYTVFLFVVFRKSDYRICVPSCIHLQYFLPLSHMVLLNSKITSVLSAQKYSPKNM